MGIYNFKARFAPRILDGSKTHTIRPYRANSDAPGKTLHLYTGVRTKQAKLLMRVPCVRIESIAIRRIEKRDKVDLVDDVIVTIDGVELSRSECEAFSRRDGFENFTAMMEFWDGRLPFAGQIVHWNYKKGVTE